MPEIEGLQEQQAALKRVKNNLTEVENINEFLKSVSRMSQEDGMLPSYLITVTFTNGMDLKRYKSEMAVPDNRFILDAVQKHKENIVRDIREDASKYRIGLSAQENATLDWRLVLD